MENTAQTQKAKVAINGFGRIGRAAFKILASRSSVEVVAVNDLTNPRVLAHLLKYDTAYGKSSEEIHLEEDGEKIELTGYSDSKEFFQGSGDKTYLVYGDTKVKVLSEPEPAELPWKEMEVDLVFECTGRFTKDDAAKAHIQAGAKKVVLSAPSKGGSAKTYLKGVNAHEYSGEDLISNASCTTNCIAPVINILNDAFGVKKSAMTTIHAVTSTQNIVDGPSRKDMRRARAADYNVIPTTTGAALATTKVIPSLDKKFDGMAVRVPVLVGSISDITVLVNKKTSVKEVNQVFTGASKTEQYKGIVEVSHEPLVSSDIVGSDFSAIVDLGMIKVVDGDLLKILAWYDNEWGYSNRLVDVGLMMIQN